MPYTINKYNGSQITVVADGTIDSTLDIKLIGKNYAGYGEVQNENFVFMLENFASTNPPPKPISGQIWYDSSNSKLKFYDGGKFKTTGGAEVSATAPTGLSTGDFWFDTQNKQLYAWNGLTYTLIGPQGVAGSGTTQMRSRSLRDSLGSTHAVIEAITDNKTAFIISPDDEFTLDNATNAITGFTKIRKGITLAYADSPSTGRTQDFKFYGTATDADRLGGYAPTSYVRTDNLAFASLVNFSDAGYEVGTELKVFNDDGGTIPTFRNQVGNTIVFQTTSSGTKTPMKLVGLDILPGADVVSDIGGTGNKFKSVYANSFIGTATKADTLNVDGAYRSTSVDATASTVAARTTVSEVVNGVTITPGALKATYFVGIATQANYADLAENYIADAEYEVGTVLMVGGEAEVTAAQPGFRAIGTVSENPAYLMNADLVGGTAVALKGRVPVKVIGPVTKGQRLVAGLNGTAQAAFGNSSDVFAIALENNNDASVKLVECVIL